MPSASLSLLISVQLIISIDSTYLIRSIAILMLDFNSYISLISLSLLLAYSNACLVHIIGTRKKYLGFIESYTGWLNRRRFIYLILNWMTQLEEVQCLGNVSGKNFEPSGNNVCFFFLLVMTSTSDETRQSLSRRGFLSYEAISISYYYDTTP